MKKLLGIAGILLSVSFPEAMPVNFKFKVEVSEFRTFADTAPETIGTEFYPGLTGFFSYTYDDADPVQPGRIENGFVFGVPTRGMELSFPGIDFECFWDGFSGWHNSENIDFLGTAGDMLVGDNYILETSYLFKNGNEVSLFFSDSYVWATAEAELRMTVSPMSVPEPGTHVLMAFGVALVISAGLKLRFRRENFPIDDRLPR